MTSKLKELNALIKTFQKTWKAWMNVPEDFSKWPDENPKYMAFKDAESALVKAMGKDCLIQTDTETIWTDDEGHLARGHFTFFDFRA
jgi:hypothetical protein